MHKQLALLSLLPLLALLACGAATPDSTGSDSESDSSVDSNAHVDDAHYFPDGAPWYQDVSDRAVDPTSEVVIGALQQAGWGSGHFQIDFSLDVLQADAATPKVDFTPTEDFYAPDCDQVPVPLPEGGNVEGETGYACTNGGDCHLLIEDREELRLYEMWRADVRADGTFYGGCLAAWDMARVYGDEGRGVQCTSADAAGYPIAPLLFNADEIAAGVIDHAIRFVLPNESIRDGVFYAPATHATNAGGGGDEAVPYGARLRLKPDFDVSRISDPEARVVVTALQRYGMVLADGGNIALTAQADTHTQAKWADLFDSHALYGIEPADFELLELNGPAIPLTYACERSAY
jgi:serine/threonine-protein kinase